MISILRLSYNPSRISDQDIPSHFALGVPLTNEAQDGIISTRRANDGHGHEWVG
jgi:hypothetical protein